MSAHLAPPAPSRITACTTQEVIAAELKKRGIPAQPAQAVDVEAIQEVIESLTHTIACKSSLSQMNQNKWANKLTRALSGKPL